MTKNNNITIICFLIKFRYDKFISTNVDWFVYSFKLKLNVLIGNGTLTKT